MRQRRGSRHGPCSVGNTVTLSYRQAAFARIKHRNAQMKISIVDTSPVLAGSTTVEAFRTTIELADQAGFSRYWLSELHGVLTNAGTTPEVAVAAVASRTTQS